MSEKRNICVDGVEYLIDIDAAINSGAAEYLIPPKRIGNTFTYKGNYYMLIDSGKMVALMDIKTGRPWSYRRKSTPSRTELAPTDWDVLSHTNSDEKFIPVKINIKYK